MNNSENSVLTTAQSPNSFREIILHSKEPLVIKNLVECELTSWDLDIWGKELEHEMLPFRCGRNEFTKKPQWESTCTTKNAKFADFLKTFNSESKEWWYFDYKYLCEWLTDKNNLKCKIDWSILGFPEITSNESTIWIGSRGAHTPCHMDTYGCNIVLQIFGRKQWLLFPPEQNLKPTRIPFEESSIYSKLNFFSPTLADFKGVSNCRKVILEPGDVLVVPHKWWHYVENLETSISVNAWLPLPHDDYQRIKECVASIFMEKITSNNPELINIVLNPNMKKEMIDSDAALQFITSKEKFKAKSKIPKSDDKPVNSNNDLAVNIDKVQSKHIFKIPVLSHEELINFLEQQAERFCNTNSRALTEDVEYAGVVTFLDAVTDEEVLELIVEKLFGK